MKTLFLLTLLMAACSPIPTGKSCTKINQSRCTPDNRVELCAPNGQWITVLDCTEQMGSDWFCAPRPGSKDDHTCRHTEDTP